MSSWLWDPEPSTEESMGLIRNRIKEKFHPLLIYLSTKWELFCSMFFPLLFHFDLQNRIFCRELDIRVKKAKYIDKNNTLNQEFYFAHPSTKIKVNDIYNTHFTGSQLLDFGCREM